METTDRELVVQEPEISSHTHTQHMTDELGFKENIIMNDHGDGGYRRASTTPNHSQSFRFSFLRAFVSPGFVSVCRVWNLPFA